MNAPTFATASPTHSRRLAGRMPAAIAVGVALVATTAALPAHAAPAGDRDTRVLVSLRVDDPAAVREAKVQLRHEYPGAVIGGPADAPFLAMRVPDVAVADLRARADVASVTVDRLLEASGTSSNGSASGQQLPSMWDYSRIGADWANTNGWTGRGTRIAVIDSGVDRNNPYLSGRVSTEACFATNENGTGACPGGVKYSYSTTSAAGVLGAAAPCGYHGDCAHGTHVAHTAAGAYGVARGATIIAIQTSHRAWSAKKQAYVPMHYDSDVANALWYVHTVLPSLGVVAAAVNMSISGGGYTTSCDTTGYAGWIQRLRTDLQIPVVISSGNDNYYNGIGFPGCVSAGITVGNTTLSGTADAVFGGVSFGSNSSAAIDLLAPGTDVCSAVPSTLDGDGSRDGWSCGWVGTSMAAPHVAGALAILTQKRPSATVDQMLAALQRAGSTGGVSVTDSRNGITRTRLNIANAVYYF